MAFIEFTDSDILGSKLITPGWYEVVIESVKPELSKKQDSTNYWLKGKVIKNADNGSIEFQGCPTPFLWMINSKAGFSAVPILRAIGKEPTPGSRFDPETLAGKRLEMFIGNGINPNNQQMTNVQTGQYRPLRETVSAE